MSPDVIFGLVLAFLSGAIGYTVAVVKRDTAIALLQKAQVDTAKQLGEQNTLIVRQLDAQNEKIDRHLRIMIRLIVDFARKSGVEMRTADVLEITAPRSR